MPCWCLLKTTSPLPPKSGLYRDGGPQQYMPRLVLVDEICPTPHWMEGFPLNYGCVITFRFRPTGCLSLLFFSPNAVLQMLTVYHPWFCLLSTYL